MTHITNVLRPVTRNLVLCPLKAKCGGNDIPSYGLDDQVASWSLQDSRCRI
jgi:hypothetical protein